MIRTGAQYREGLRDGREVWIDGERVKDITSHPATRPIVDIRARIFDMQHENDNAATMTYVEDNKRHSIFNRLPRAQQDWHDKWRAVDAVMNDIGGVVTRVGDETVGEMWSLFDGRDVLQRDRSALQREHHAPHPGGDRSRRLSRLRQYRSQG